jgi:hypothetical protein
MSDLDLSGLRPLALPVKAPIREEDCGTCYWARPANTGGLECHGEPPTCHVLMVPHPLQPRAQMPQPLCVWPPVRAGLDFCRLWEAKAEVKA